MQEMNEASAENCVFVSDRRSKVEDRRSKIEDRCRSWVILHGGLWAKLGLIAPSPYDLENIKG